MIGAAIEIHPGHSGQVNHVRYVVPRDFGSLLRALLSQITRRAVVGRCAGLSRDYIGSNGIEEDILRKIVLHIVG